MSAERTFIGRLGVGRVPALDLFKPVLWLVVTEGSGGTGVSNHPVSRSF